MTLLEAMTTASTGLGALLTYEYQAWRLTRL